LWRRALTEAKSVVKRRLAPAGSRVEPPEAPYLIVPVLGQSNAVGMGLGLDLEGLDRPDPQVHQWAMCGPSKGTAILAVDPLLHEIPAGGVGFGITFAKHLAAETGRAVLLIPGARGDTSFTPKNGWTWDPADTRTRRNLYRNAIAAIDAFPSAVYLGINSSPELILSGRLAPMIADVDAARLVLEITEHATVTDYDALIRALRPLRERGVRIAVDDAGAGYASMRHILSLKCEIIKLDMSLTRDIDTDPGRRALARGLISFACEIGSDITAEGIETRGELEALRNLGVHKAQGYYLSRPGSMEDALTAFRTGCPAFAAPPGP
jgi:EAL domain-containing protein (putative c-di-GMP-specific phosphodiesterase class I)